MEGIGEKRPPFAKTYPKSSSNLRVRHPRVTAEGDAMAVPLAMFTRSAQGFESDEKRHRASNELRVRTDTHRTSRWERRLPEIGRT